MGNIRRKNINQNILFEASLWGAYIPCPDASLMETHCVITGCAA